LGEEPARRIKDEISRNREIEGFLDSATERLIAITDELTAGLGIEAVKIAKARGATAVDAVDVEAADVKLNHPQHADQVKAWLFGVGALFVGGAFSLAPTLALTKPLPHPLIWWGGVGAAMLIGVIFAGIGFPRRRKGRA
jgi:histone H3/H4